MIRSYHKKDADLLVDIWLQASLQSHDFVGEDYWRGKSGEIRNVWLPGSQTWVWEENGCCAGFISLVDEEYIGALFVDPAFQKKGIGSKLLNSLQAGRRKLRLKVFARNDHAVGFYRRHGFRVTARQTDTETGEEELLMQWEKVTEEKK